MVKYGEIGVIGTNLTNLVIQGYHFVPTPLLVPSLLCLNIGPSSPEKK